MGVLKEKEDQLKYWLTGNTDSRKGEAETYREELNQNSEELSKLKANLKSIPKIKDADKRLSWLNQRIESHKKALIYWKSTSGKKKEKKSG